jgi:SP family general alpha glucoside:H+ symporter-like MFS transporter
MVFAPESPWWLVRHGKVKEAERAMRRLQSHDRDDLARKSVALMIRTNELEKSLEEKTSFVQCFKGADFRRTEISMMAYGCQMLSGCMLSWSTTFFFSQAGLSDRAAFGLGLGQSGIGFLGTCIAWIFLRYFGRRTIYLWGMTLMSVLMVLIGICGVISRKGNSNATWGVAGCLLTWVLVYDLTVGPLAFTIIAETSSTRLRNKTISLARFSK